jgi:predicted metal-binding membrane protein
MMLPTALPMLDHLRRLVIKRRFATTLVALIAADLGLHIIDEGVDWLSAHPTVVPGVVLISAGLYQFGPLKVRCSRACRSPRGFTLAQLAGTATGLGGNNHHDRVRTPSRPWVVAGR